MLISKVIRFFSNIYWRTQSPSDYARHLGVEIGDNCMIAIREWSTEPYLITIGNNVQVTKGVMIHTHGGSHVAQQYFPNFDTFGKVKICDWAYVGNNVQIMPGVTIGEGALIAAGSIVCKSVPPKEVWGGIPAKRICTVSDYIERNLPYNLNCKSSSPEKKKQLLLSLSDDVFIKK